VDCAYFGIMFCLRQVLLKYIFVLQLSNFLLVVQICSLAKKINSSWLRERQSVENCSVWGLGQFRKPNEGEHSLSKATAKRSCKDGYLRPLLCA
jgi:hypothetical protein